MLLFCAMFIGKLRESAPFTYLLPMAYSHVDSLITVGLNLGWPPMLAATNMRNCKPPPEHSRSQRLETQSARDSSWPAGPAHDLCGLVCCSFAFECLGLPKKPDVGFLDFSDFALGSLFSKNRDSLSTPHLALSVSQRPSSNFLTRVSSALLISRPPSPTPKLCVVVCASDIRLFRKASGARRGHDSWITSRLELNVAGRGGRSHLTFGAQARENGRFQSSLGAQGTWERSQSQQLEISSNNFENKFGNNLNIIQEFQKNNSGLFEDRFGKNLNVIPMFSR